nr:MAG TPA: hypothetical protein [Caudoviricetes sp.]
MCYAKRTKLRKLIIGSNPKEYVHPSTSGHYHYSTRFRENPANKLTKKRQKTTFSV